MSFNLKSTFLIAALLATPAFAQSDEDKAEVDARVQEITTALEKGDRTVVIRGTPNRMIAAIAKRHGMNQDVFLEKAIRKLQDVDDLGTLSDIEIGSSGIEWKKTSGGKDYAIVPFSATITTKDQLTKYRSEDPVVAIKDDGKWYIVKLNEDEKAAFDSVYPEYAEIKVPPGKTYDVQ